MEYTKDLMKDLIKESKEMIKNTQETYKKVSDAIGKIKKEFESVDFSSVLKSNLNAIENLAKGALNTFNILEASIESITGKSLNIKSVTDKIKDSYVTVKDATIKVKDEITKLSEINLSKMLESGITSIGDFENSVFGILSTTSSAFNKLSEDALDIGSSVDIVRNKYYKVKDAVVALQGEALKFADIDISKAMEGSSNELLKIESGVFSVLGTLAKATDDLSGYSINTKEAISSIYSEYIKVKNIATDVKKEMLNMVSIDFSGVLTGDLGSIEKFGNGALNCMESIYGLMSSFSGSSVDITKYTDAMRVGLSGIVDVSTTVRDEVEKIGNIDFSKAVKGGVSGIAEAAGAALTNVGSIGQSVFAAVTDAVNKINKNQLKELESNYKQQNDTINKNLEERKKAIQAEADAEKEVYASQIEEYNTREEEKAAIEEEWQEYLKEYNAGISDEMTEEEYLKLEEEKAAEEEKYNNKMSMYQNDATEKQSIEDQMAMIDEERKLKEQAAEKDAFLKKEEAHKEYNRKKMEIEKKVAIANKASGIFNATISMLQGIAQAVVAGMGYGLLAIGMVPLLVGIATATGLAQINAITSQPLPEVPSFSDGGWVGKANDKKFNFLPKAASPNDRTLAWLSEGEYVLPRNEALAYQKMITSSVNNYGDSNSVKNINVYTTVNAVSNASPDLIAKSNAEAIVLAISRGY